MRPQFVDFDGDGHLDIFAATYDGSPHVARGSAEGFLEPQHVLDPDGERILLSQFWNYDEEEWDETQDTPRGHCTAALAWDWDADGDLDLLLGDYTNGKLYRRMNHGTAAEPRFAGANVPVEAGGEPFELEGGLSTPVVVDWDGDGLEDLVVGGYGDSYGYGTGAGVVWYRNTGERGKPRFAAGRDLIPRSRKDGTEPTRPDTGLYPEPVDFDGDGDLDLVVGGYSNWTPPGRALTEEETKRADELEALIAAKEQEHQAFYEKLRAFDDLSDEEREKAYMELFGSEEYTQLSGALEAAREELGELRPEPKREAFVWLYRRKE